MDEGTCTVTERWMSRDEFLKHCGGFIQAIETILCSGQLPPMPVVIAALIFLIQGPALRLLVGSRSLSKRLDREEKTVRKNLNKLKRMGLIRADEDRRWSFRHPDEWKRIIRDKPKPRRKKQTAAQVSLTYTEGAALGDASAGLTVPARRFAEPTGAGLPDRPDKELEERKERYKDKPIPEETKAEKQDRVITTTKQPGEDPTPQVEIEMVEGPARMAHVVASGNGSWLVLPQPEVEDTDTELVSALSEILGSSEADRRSWCKLDGMAIGKGLIRGTREQVTERLIFLAKCAVADGATKPAAAFLATVFRSFPRLDEAWHARFVPNPPDSAIRSEVN